MRPSADGTGLDGTGRDGLSTAYLQVLADLLLRVVRLRLELRQVPHQVVRSLCEPQDLCLHEDGGELEG
jgi:hypothetical protein